jgi:peptidoglycan/xylan/chitin deacetylase (PgdA/CDA1 family)
MFAQQMEFLREYRRVVPLAEVVEQVSAGHSPPAGTVCITLDDGYLDTLTVAAPILARLGLPAILYLATGYVERQQAQWADVLRWQIHRRTADRLRVPWTAPLDLAHPPSRHAAYTVLHQHLLEADEAERTELLAEVGRQLAPTGQPPRITLGWDDVRELRRRYPEIAIGGHTRDHIDLTSKRGAAAREQIEGCAADLRRELGLQPSHFSYPYARWWDETRNLVKAAGWASAVGMGPGIRIMAGSDVFAMPRIETPQTMTELRFKTSGAYPGALAMFNGA